MPRSLDLARLKQFEAGAGGGEGAAAPAAAAAAPAAVMAGAAGAERWPSREPVRDGQISIKAPVATIERFRRLCRDDRRTYSDMLAILMAAYEEK